MPIIVRKSAGPYYFGTSEAFPAGTVLQHQGKRRVFGDYVGRAYRNPKHAFDAAVRAAYPADKSLVILRVAPVSGESTDMTGRSVGMSPGQWQVVSEGPAWQRSMPEQTALMSRTVAPPSLFWKARRQDLQRMARLGRPREEAAPLMVPGEALALGGEPTSTTKSLKDIAAETGTWLVVK